MFIRLNLSILISIFLAINTLRVVNCQPSDSILYLINHGRIKDDIKKFNLLCRLASNSVDPDTILKYSDQAIVLAEKLNIIPSQAYVYKGFGYLNSGKLAAALECFMKAAGYYEADKSKVGLAATYTYISEAYHQQENYDNARHYLKSAVEIFREEKDTIRLASALHNLGYTNYSMGQYDTALVLYSETSEIYRNLGYQSEYAFCIGNSGLVYSRISDYRKAEEFLLRAIEMLNNQGDERAVTQFIIEYAGILQHKGKINEGIATAKSGFDKAKKNKKDEEIPSDVKEKSEDLEKAITALKDEQKAKLTAFGKDNKLAKQLVDLALLANGMLKGEDLDKFVKRSFELIK